MSIERFDMGDVCGGEYNCGMTKSADGEFIAFTDFEAAEGKLAKIREYAEELKDLVPDDEYCFGQKIGNQILAILDKK